MEVVVFVAAGLIEFNSKSLPGAPQRGGNLRGSRGGWSVAYGYLSSI